MAEYCLDCFLKSNPGFPKERLVISESDDLELCEGCGKMKSTIIRFKRNFWGQIRWLCNLIRYGCKKCAISVPLG